MLLMFTGCASTQTRYNNVERGQSKDQILDSLGKPDYIDISADGKDVYYWNTDRFTRCGLTFDADHTVVGKQCNTDSAAEARYQAANAMALRYSMETNRQRQIQQDQSLMQSYQNQTQQYHPLQNTYRGPTQTNCTGNRIGSQTYMNCSSY